MTADCVTVSSYRKSKGIFILLSQYNFAMQDSQTFRHSYRRQSYVTNYKTKKHQKPYLRFLQIHNSQNSPENHITEQTCKNISRWFVVLFDNIHHRRTWKKLTSDFIRKQGERSRYVYHQWFSNDFLGLSRDLSVDASLISGFIIKSLSCSMFNLVWMTEYEKGWGFFSELMKENISWLGITMNWK